MPITTRVKLLTSATYSPTNPASEAAIRAQIDGSVQEVYDIATTELTPLGTTVNLTGNQTVAGVKTFSSSPVVPTPTTDMQASTKKYVDDTTTGIVLGQVPDNSLTEAKMANAMKKMAGGVAPYDDVMFESGGTLEDYSEKVTTNAMATGTVSIDLSLGNVFDITLTGTTTFTFDNPSASGKSCSFTMLLRQGGTAQTVTWPASVKWSNDSIPVISDINKTCIFSFITIDGGTRFYGTAVTKLTT